MKIMLLLCALIVGSGTMWADETATFDFDMNAGSDFGITGTSSNSSTAGDITSTVSATINGVTITITPVSSGTNNRFWNTSPKLRLYGGTMTISAGNNTLKSIAFTVGSGKWNTSNSASTGSVSGSGTSYTWSPTQNTSPTSVEFTIVGNTQIKKMVITYEAGDNPSISANNPSKLDYDATSGEISYTINNAVEGASVSATTTADWISNLSSDTAGKVTYTVSKNTTLNDRNATVTLTYAKGETTYATKAVTVSQGHLDVAAPTFGVEAGTYNEAKSVEISCTTEGATIYYTTNGENPTTSSSVYSSPISVDVSKTIKAIAVKDEVSSAIAEAAYELKVATPTITPNGAAFEESQTVTLACTNSDVTIKYTLDGTEPTSASTTYTNALELTATTTVKAFATKEGWTDSEVATATFTKVDLSTAFVKTGLSAVASDDVIVIVGDNGSNYAMSNNNGIGSAPSAVSVSISNNIISGIVADNLKWNVSSSNDGFTFYPDGSTDKWLYCTNTNNGVRVGTNDNKTFKVDNNYLKHNFTSRYVGIYNSQDWRSYTSINSNISGQSFAIYKQGISVTIAEACTDGEKYYSTFSSSVPFKFPSNVTVSEIGIDSEGKLIVENYAEGAVVPANTGVMISAATPGKKTFTPASGGSSVLGDGNCLRPSGFAISDLTADDMSAAAPSCKYYRLTMHDGTKLGFWWGADGGQSFDIAANKAYLAVPKAEANARNGFTFDDEATGISNVNVNLNDNENCYDLQGRKVSKPGKGLYIVNGKKVVIK